MPSFFISKNTTIVVFTSRFLRGRFVLDVLHSEE